MAFERYPSRDPNRNYFPVPNSAMQRHLPWKMLSVYLYLISLQRCHLKPALNSADSIAKVFGIGKVTAEKQRKKLLSSGLLSSVGPMLMTRDCFQDYEEPEKFFPLPREIFTFGLSQGEIALYAFLMYRENRKTHQCRVSHSDIADWIGMSSNTIAKYVDSLVEKGFIFSEHSTVTFRDGKTYRGKQVYTIRPLEEAKRRSLSRQMDLFEVEQARQNLRAEKTA